MEILLMVLGAIALGAIIVTAVALSVRWIVRRIKERLATKRFLKTALMDVQKMARNATNSMTLSALEDLASYGCTHMVVDLDEQGNMVGEPEMYRNVSELDREVEELLGRDGIVVIET